MVRNYSHVLPELETRTRPFRFTSVHSWSDGSTRAALARVYWDSASFAFCVRWTAPGQELGYDTATLEAFLATCFSKISEQHDEIRRYRKLAASEKIGFGLSGEIHVEGFQGMFLNHCEGGAGHATFRLVELYASSEEADNEYGHIIYCISLLLNGLSSSIGEFRSYALLPGVPVTDQKWTDSNSRYIWTFEPDDDQTPYSPFS